MQDEDEQFSLAQIESNSQLINVANSNSSEDLCSNYAGCKQAVHTMLDLSDQELAKIEEHLRVKILKNGESFMNKYDSMRADGEKVKVEYEQHFAELEATYLETQTKFETELNNSNLYQAKATGNGQFSNN